MVTQTGFPQEEPVCFRIIGGIILTMEKESNIKRSSSPSTAPAARTQANVMQAAVASSDTKSSLKYVNPLVYITRVAMLVCVTLWFVIWVMTVISPPSSDIRTIISLQATGSWLTLVPAIIVSYFLKSKVPSIIGGIIFIVLLVMALIPFTYPSLFGLF